MINESVAPRLDVRALAQSAGSLSGAERLSRFPRIVEASLGLAPDEMVRWAAHGETRPDQLGQPQYWLHLEADARVPQTCQRCLEGMQVHLQVDRWFRFVSDEASAMAQDETCEEEILVLAHDFDLHELVEDELLLELPYIARHDSCPAQPKMVLADPDFVAEPERPNPFAALAALRTPKGP